MFHVKHFFIKVLLNILNITNCAIKFCLFLAKLHINLTGLNVSRETFKPKFLIEKSRNKFNSKRLTDV